MQIAATVSASVSSAAGESTPNCSSACSSSAPASERGARRAERAPGSYPGATAAGERPASSRRICEPLCAGIARRSNHRSCELLATLYVQCRAETHAEALNLLLLRPKSHAEKCHRNIQLHIQVCHLPSAMTALSTPGESAILPPSEVQQYPRLLCHLTRSTHTASKVGCGFFSAHK